MQRESIKMYKDGNRLILVFENTDTEIKEMIGKLIGAVTVKEVTNVAPVEVKDEPFQLTKSVITEDINEEKLIREEGFEGLCKVYQFYKENAAKLNQSRSAKLKQVIMYYMDYYKKRDMSTIPDEEMMNLLRIGSKYIFPNTMNSCLQQSGFISIDDFLASGRRNLEDAYLACFQIDK